MGLNRGKETIVESSSGGKKGQKPERYSLLPIEALDHVARLYAAGAEKYDDHNWRAGYDWSLSYDALMRHVTAFWAGEDIDPEWGERNIPHLAAVAFHAFTLLVFMENNPEFDNRPGTVKEASDGTNDAKEINVQIYGDERGREVTRDAFLRISRESGNYGRGTG